MKTVSRSPVTIILAILAAGVCAEARPIVWVIPALSRVGPNDPAQEIRRIALWAGRGEYESFQIVVQDGTHGFVDGRIVQSNLTGPNGLRISRNNIQLFRERFVHVAVGSPDRGGTNRPFGPGWYADGLIPLQGSGADFSGVDRGMDGLGRDPSPGAENSAKNQAFWVDVFVPRTAKAGVYSGKIVVTGKDGTGAIEVTLHVWNFELPLRPTLRSAFWIFNDTSASHAVSYADRPENQKLLLEHKIMPLTVEAPNEREFIGQYGLNFSLLKWFDTASYGRCNQSAAPSVADLVSLRQRHQPDLPLYVYLGDEVTQCTNIFPSLKEWSRNVRRAGLVPMITATPVSDLRDDGSGDGRGVADIWVLLPKQFVSNAADVVAAQKQGGQFWAYTAVVQDGYSPKWGIDFAPANYRIFGGFLSQSENVSGILYWAVNSWAIQATSDPWNNLIYKENAKGIPPGEGWLVYPDGRGGFVPSIRLKWIRKSVEDYEYVEMLKKAGRGDWALQDLRSIATDWARWSQNGEEIEAVRRRLGEELDRLYSNRGNIAKGTIN